MRHLNSSVEIKSERNKLNLYVKKHKKNIDFLVTLTMLMPLLQHYLKYDVILLSDFQIELLVLLSSISLLFYNLYIFKVILYFTGNYSSWLIRQILPFFAPSVFKVKNDEILFEFLSDYLISETLFANLLTIYITSFSLLEDSLGRSLLVYLFYVLCLIFVFLLSIHKIISREIRMLKIVLLFLIGWISDLVPYLIILYPMHRSDKLSDIKILVLMGIILLFMLMLEIIDAIAQRKSEYFRIDSEGEN